MAHDFDIVELRNRRLGDIFECLTRGVGYEMKMKPAHRGTMAGMRRKRQSRIRQHGTKKALWISDGKARGAKWDGRFITGAADSAPSLVHKG
jgi:hypothetical protein